MVITSALSPGEHIITLTAKDSDGATDEASIEVGVDQNQVPSASINQPADGVSFRKDVTVSFKGEGSDPETGELTGEALTWKSSEGGEFGQGREVTTDQLAVGDHTITLTATDPDGFSSSDEVEISIEANHPPQVTISSPVDGADFDDDDLIPFEGMVSDEEDDSIPGSHLSWSSDRDGHLGSGKEIVTGLSEGQHTVTLQATDSDGASAEDQISVSVVEFATLEVAASTTGDTLDDDGYTVRLDDDLSREVGPNGRVTFTRVKAGRHEIRLSAIQANCETAGQNPRSLDISEDATVNVSFDASCRAALFNRIAFQTERTGSDDIFVMEPDGSGTQLLIGGPSQETVPAFAPVPTRIAFTSDRAGNSDIYTVNVDGTGLTRLTTDPAFDGVPKYSPDGSRIAFMSRRVSISNLDIYRMQADGSGITRLTSHHAPDVDPVWSPDGSRILFSSSRSGNTDLFTMRPDGTDISQLTTAPEVDESPSWSPDGSQIAFESRRDGNPEVYVMDADGGNVRRLTHDSAFDTGPFWSPDGQWIVFYSDRDGNDEIYRIRPDGSRLENLGHFRVCGPTTMKEAPGSEGGSRTPPGRALVG